MSKKTKAKPTIRIVRHLARSGGTLLSKCIGCMDHVTLLSEVHPADLRTTSPVSQAHKWFDLINAKDLALWKMRPPTAMQFVMLCETRARARGDMLVLRDWSHLDYIGVPFAKPGYGFALAETLESVYEIKSVTTTRHPVDQFLSLLQLPIVAQRLEFDAYVHGCMRFAEYAHEHGFYRYEDFTKDPDTVLRKICDELAMPFDAGYAEKWHAYTTITGDTNARVGRGATKKTIEPMGRKPIDDELLEKFRANAEYQRACALLGYEA